LPPYRRLAGGRRWRRFRHKGWFAPYLLERHAAPDEGYQDSHLNAVLRRSVEQARLPHYLRLEDRNSMAHGLEARLPFMDYRLVSLAFRVPADQKMQGAWNKVLLRRSVRGRVPDSVRNRVEKMGFPTSLHLWMTVALGSTEHCAQGCARTIEEGGGRRCGTCCPLPRPCTLSAPACCLASSRAGCASHSRRCCYAPPAHRRMRLAPIAAARHPYSRTAASIPPRSFTSHRPALHPATDRSRTPGT